MLGKELLCVSLLIVSGFGRAEAFRILFLAPFPGPSHWMMFEKVIEELCARGHHVTAITSFPLRADLTNYTELLIDPPWNIKDHMSSESIYDLNFGGDMQKLWMYVFLGLESSRHGLENEKVQQLIASNNEHYDLVIAEQFFQESWLMFAHKYKAPIITISTYGNSDFMDRAMGLLTPWSHVPHMVLDYDDRMSFFQRCYNFYLSMVDVCIRNFHYLPEQEKLAKRYFSVLGTKLPSVFDLEKSISAILINNHISLSPPRPSMPGLINIAGVHIKAPKPLPPDVQMFLDDAENGVIYFSLGSFMKSAHMPPSKVVIFLDVFRQMKQRVLWKWEDEKNMPNLPPNVIMRKWLPQSDVLAHKNVILFITHGGLFGTQEGTYRGVPMLFLPFYGDQHRNALKAFNGGYGLAMKFTDINKQSLASTIQEMVTNSSYLIKAREIAAVFSDNLIPPMQEAIYWIEYVVKHKGAPHLRSSAINKPVYEYLLWDVIGFYLAIICLAVYSAVAILKTLFRIARGQSSNKTIKHD